MGCHEKEKCNRTRILTSTWPVIDHNSEAIIKSFLFSNYLSRVKKSAKNVKMPLLSLESKVHRVQEKDGFSYDS